MTPTFAIVIGAWGNPTLKDTLDSIQRQDRIPGDRVIVCIDSFEQGDRPDVQALVRGYGDGFDCVAYDAGYHFMGVEQFNYAIDLAHDDPACTHIMSLGDDDVYVDGAYAALRPLVAADPLRPLLFRFVSPCRSVLWDRPRMWPCLISGQCIVAAKQHVGMASLVHTCTVDYGWMVDTIDRSGRSPQFLDYIGVIARPDRAPGGGAKHGVWRCTGCGRNGWLEDAVDPSRDICCGRPVDRAPSPIMVATLPIVYGVDAQP